MRMKKIEIEIPENMEIKCIRDHIIQYATKNKHDLVVELIKRQPSRLVFEEIIGRNYVEEGEYWSPQGDFSYLTQASSKYNITDNDIVWKLIEE